MSNTLITIIENEEFFIFKLIYMKKEINIKKIDFKEKEIKELFENILEYIMTLDKNILEESKSSDLIIDNQIEDSASITSLFISRFTQSLSGEIKTIIFDILSINEQNSNTNFENVI